MCSIRVLIPKWKVKTKLKVALYVLIGLKESKTKQAKNASISTIAVTLSKLRFFSTYNVYFSALGKRMFVNEIMILR